MPETAYTYPLFFQEDVQSAVAAMAGSDSKDRGAVHTRREVVDFILDLVGYTPDGDLVSTRVLEPSFGQGEFVVAVVQRLLDSYFRCGGRSETALSALRDSLRAVELNESSFERTRQRVMELLLGREIAPVGASELVSCWLLNDDFLLTPLSDGFNCIVGNPPYVRQELIPDPLIQEYRRRYQTIYDRADLYVPFIERGLGLLSRNGILSFICSDRWMKNRYGGPLRKLVSKGYHLKYYVDMVDTQAFDSEVSAYPAIFAIERSSGSDTRIARRPDIEPQSLRSLAHAIRDDGVLKDQRVEELKGVVQGSHPWLLDSPGEVALLRRLETELPLLVDTGCQVGIGVATGADSIYIRPTEELPVEQSRKLPLVMAPDIRTGRINWSGKYILNPFEQDGTLASLERYPRFASYLKSNKERVRQRHVAKKNPERWYRTIDRIYEDLTYREKLLIPDIKGNATVVYDSGSYYPHHNLYHVTSSTWDLRALQAVLRSSVAEFFVAMYCVKMRGGYLRFQAQYIRRIRLPDWETVPDSMRQRLIHASEAPDRAVVDAAAFDLYDLDAEDQKTIRIAVGGAKEEQNT